MIRILLKTINNNKPPTYETLESVRYFLSCGVTVDHTDADGMTPLYKAGRDGKHQALQILIEVNANNK